MIIVDRIYGFGKYCSSPSHNPTTVTVEINGRKEKRTVRAQRSKYGFIIWHKIKGHKAKVKAIMCERCWIITIAECVKQAGPQFMDFVKFNLNLGPKEMR